MNVCLVTAEYPPQAGGVGDYTRELARALQRRGAAVEVLTGSGPAPDDAAGPVMPLRRVRGWDWRAWADLGRALGELQPQVVHIQYQAAAYGMHPAINLWPRWAGRRRRVVVTFHDLRVPYLFPKAGPLRFRAVLAMARSAARAIVTNEEDQAVLAPLVARPPALIPIGSNIHPAPPAGYDRTAWRARLGVAEHETVLAYFGFLSDSKGGEELVRALATLRRRGLPVSLWLVGAQVGASDPTQTAYLVRVQHLIAELELEPHVRWTGFLAPAEVSANLLAADLCVLPYRDGVSFRRGSLMAALAHGLPVVSTTPRRPLAEVADGGNMALVPPGDAEALAAHLEALIADPAARRRLSEGARRLAAAFDWDAIAARTLEVYDALV
ncbi:MAG TPA: glycosyltransferase family 4 protein [Anaerolineae bacterium]|nr:glycosyltransferase family 4 protein [Anaerolineae bacterium]HOR00230.1 glycosyltransferase family 4 protein [Anaerolineae bacterium]HPL27493.1 glycosyltransferase family 4 protein [Anaerolineae bacterium]